ncbi:hypothetical protein BJ741DRAFT_714282 [Chytriomyces cf. hyalinus JEL632]|nr:hypothetical protein BJ741DRAFT_714282 [Chytriomyces cf. hyalinus JEL632]
MNNPNTPPDEIANTIHPPVATSLTLLQQHQFNSQPQHSKPSLAVADWPHHHTASFMNSIATPTASPLELPWSATTRLRMGSLSANPAANSNNFTSPCSFAGAGRRSHSLDHGSTPMGLLNLQSLNYTVAGVGPAAAVHSWVTATGLLQNFQSPNVFNNLSSGNGGNGASLRDDGMSHASMSETVYTSFNAPAAQSMQWNSMSELSPTSWNPINTFPTFHSPHMSHSSLLNAYSFQDHRQPPQPHQPQQQQHLQFQQQQQQLQQQQQQQRSCQFSNVHRNSSSISWGSTDPLSILTHQNQTHNNNNILPSDPHPIITTCSPLQFSSIVSGGSPPHQYSSTSLTTASPHSLQQPLSAIETVYTQQAVQQGEPTLVHSIALQPSPSVTDKLSPRSISGRELLGRRARRTVAKRDVDKDLGDREKLDASDLDVDDSEGQDEEDDSDTASDRGGASTKPVVKRVGGRKKKAASSSSLGSSYKNNKRFRIPRDQMVWLKKVFSETPLPSIERMAEIANEVDVDVHKIKIWFQNRRAANKRRAKKSRSSD